MKDLRLVTEQIKSVLDLRNIIPDLTRKGNDYVRLCPFHAETEPSFFVRKEFYRCFGCQPADELVRTPTGPKAIGDIEIGDLVLTASNKIRPVTENRCHLFDGKMLSIRTRKNGFLVRLTPNHKVPVLKTVPCKQPARPGRICMSSCRQRCPSKFFLDYKIEWIEAGQLNVNDCLLLEVDETVTKQDVVDISHYKIDKGIGKLPRDIPDKLPITPQLLRLLGLFVAEGSTNQGRVVRWSFGGERQDLADETQATIRDVFGLNATICRRKDNPTAIDVWCCNTYLCNAFSKLCGVGAANKRFPRELMHISPEMQQHMLSGYIDGDGHTNKHGRASTSTISIELSLQVRDILLRLGFMPSTHIWLDNTDVAGVHHCTSYTTSWEPNGKKHTTWWYYENGQKYWALPIREIKQSDYHDVVHDITVDDEHSYQTLSFAVSNCDAKGDVFQWYQEHHGFDFMTALTIAAGEAGIRIDDDLQEAVQKAATEHKKLENALKSYQNELGKNVGAMDYLLGRGLTEETIHHFSLGYCSERNAIAIPIMSKAGRIQTFAYRMLEGDDRYRIYNTTTWKKSDGLYNLPGLDNEGLVFVAEGFFDVMTIHQAGFPKVVGMMGNSLSDAHIAQIETNSIVFVPDAKADSDFDIFKRALLRLRRIHDDISVKVALLESGDANSAGVEAVKTAIENAETAEFAVLKHDLNLCADRDEEYKAAREIGRQVNDEYVKDDVVKYLAKRWDKSEAVVRTGLWRSEETGVKIYTVSMAVDELFKNERTAAEDGLHMAWPQIAKYINRPHTQQMLFFAGRAGVGKTMWACNYVHQMKEHETPTLFLSFEQPVTELVHRMMAMASPDMETPMTPIEISQAIIHDTGEAKALGSLIELYYPHLRLVNERLDVKGIKDTVVDASYSLGQAVKVLIMDYVGLVKSVGRGSTYEKVSEVCRDIQAMTKELDVLGIYLYQLSREGKSGEDKVTMDMLRDSGVAEEVADYIIGAWRDKADDDISIPGFERFHFSICKNRHGKKGDGLLWFDTEHLLMVDGDALGDILPYSGRAEPVDDRY